MTDGGDSATRKFVTTVTNPTTASLAVVTLKENDSDTSNDDLGQQHTNKTTRTDGNNSDAASGYFTEERVNTSVEDVSTLLSPVAMDYSSSSSSSSQTDDNSCDSNISLELHLTNNHPTVDTAKTKLKTEKQPNRTDNTFKPSECLQVQYYVFFSMLFYVCSCAIQ